jgi:hypothetical protein
MIKLKSILFWVLFLAVQGVLLSLSQWQWDRLDQKEKAIELRDKRWSSEAIPVEQAIVQGGMTPEWSHVMVCGQVKPKLYAKVSYLAGLPKAPSRTAPTTNFTRAKERQLVVLEAMLEAGFITQEQFDLAIAEPINIQPASQPETANEHLESQRRRKMMRGGCLEPASQLGRITACLF